ncbi:MAG: sulfatase [Erysipelotrichaceae bacterium]|nr:sulfatase [Erysipelotrichaceae bacterium]MDY5253029.1 sulfatase [Erysipelotrichaceae bacterium]
MKAVMVMFDTLSRRYLSTYGNDWVKTPNFERLKNKAIQFNNFFAGSLPCMPARRELHTGRYNFLHRSWGPMEPYDFSCFEALKKQKIYTHIVTDHSHYWEDGGATYLPRYTTWEGFRGQEGDRWVGMVNASGRLEIPKQATTTKMGESFFFNHANRTRMIEEKDFSSVKTFEAGINFINDNKDEDNWLLQIEAFDPHEPFYVPQRFLDLYDDIVDDVVFEWPSYAPVCEDAALKKQIIMRYAALISMCDHYLGKVLDVFDEHDLWQDTMLIVNTDHGFLMGEHEWWGKNVMPSYNEIVHLPFYYYDPRIPNMHGEVDMLAQTIDIPATLLNYFKVEKPSTMLGEDLYQAIVENKDIHEAVLFGSFGGHINVCDGRYVYMRSSQDETNAPLYEYTLMPTRMRNYFEERNLKQATLDDTFACFRNYPVLKVRAKAMFSSYRFGNKLFDLACDEKQKHNLEDPELELKMIEKMRILMLANEAPQEQYVRLGMHKDHALTLEELKQQKEAKLARDTLSLSLELSYKEQQQILFVRDFVKEDNMAKIYQAIEDNYGQKPLIEILEQALKASLANKAPQMMIKMLTGFLQAVGNPD